MQFFQKFRRITYSTAYLPEIDGLRFLAIFSVVVIMHINHYIDEKFYNNHLIESKYWKNLILEGGNGVPLFFVISGFILSLPFAKWRLSREKKIVLKNYYLRRLTRLEPPYIIALVIFFIANIWLLHRFSFQNLLPHFLASVFYLHTIIYHSFSPVLPVAWSLEVEVQFYILAPLFFLVYMIRSAVVRWLISLAVILISAVYWFDVWKTPHVFMYLHFFFMGIFLSDLYCSNTVIIKKETAGAVVGLAALAGFIFLPSIHFFAGYLLKIVCIFFLFHTVLTSPVMKKLFSLNGMVLIGGMCYSIYLLHYAVVSAVGRLVLGSGFKTIPHLPLAFAFAISVLFVSAFYFIWVEKPFMRPFGLERKDNSLKKS